ncbi:hypothetical protein [Nocardia sp. XZ_19_369]|uniref:hypothetical protein n=1 Tax=Nocardia sp. XZ_19_369 TaxID=2769487 RepID=UPI00188E81C0|nr:hypothetical protein [Nocardia sp. XZ_19_369]
MNNDNNSGLEPEAGSIGDILWPIEKIAAYWGVTENRARALLADRGINRVSGWPADQVQQVIRRQGTRTDLGKSSESTPRIALAPHHIAALDCLADGQPWTATRLAVTIDPRKDSEAAIKAGRTLMSATCDVLHRLKYVVPCGEGWTITPTGRGCYSRYVENWR